VLIGLNRIHKRQILMLIVILKKNLKMKS